MDVRDAETFYHSLQSSLSNAQKKLETRQAEYLQSLININDEGSPEYISWYCELPAGDGSVKNQELLRMPLVSLFPSESIEISELSIDFNCAIKREKKKTETDVSHYRVTQLERTKAKQNLFKINLSIENDYQPEVTINDVPVDNYLDVFDAQLINRPSWYSARHKITGKIYLLCALSIVDLLLVFI